MCALNVWIFSKVCRSVSRGVRATSLSLQPPFVFWHVPSVLMYYYDDEVSVVKIVATPTS
jgi:hypothetical protein